MRALVFLATQNSKNEKFGIIEIALAVDSPVAFTAKILRDLSKNKIISSSKGPTGGFFLNGDQLHQPIINIVEAIDGLLFFDACGLGLKQCSEIHPCPMHTNYKQIRQQLRENFQSTSLFELAGYVNEGTSFIRNPLLKNADCSEN